MEQARDPLSTPTRITFAGDWHANTNWAVSAVYVAAEMGADVIVHTGDFGYLFYPRFLRPLGAALEETGLRLLFVDGNHENHQWLAQQPKRPDGLRMVHHPTIWHLPRGFRWTWGGVRFLALGGAHSVDRAWRLRSGALWQREETLTPIDVQIAVDGGPADVMVTHDCPAGVKIPFIDDPGRIPPFPPAEIARAGEHRKLLRTVVDAVRPASLWHGHYHLNHAQDVNLGWPMAVVGLDCDGTSFTSNLVTVDLDKLRRGSAGLGATAGQLAGAA